MIFTQELSLLHEEPFLSPLPEINQVFLSLFQLAFFMYFIVLDCIYDKFLIVFHQPPDPLQPEPDDPDHLQGVQDLAGVPLPPVSEAPREMPVSPRREAENGDQVTNENIMINNVKNLLIPLTDTDPSRRMPCDFKFCPKHKRH